MQQITYTEFGITSLITKYSPIGPKLKGMKVGKPFVMNGQMHINTVDSLNKIEQITFKDEHGELSRSEVCLDTDTRVAGIIANNRNQILILKIERDTMFYCFPGGHLRECESVNECLIREMSEETGIDITGSKVELLLETHSEGFGPEKFFLIDIGNRDIEFEDEDPDDNTSKLTLRNAVELRQIQRIFPKQVADLLLSKLVS